MNGHDAETGHVTLMLHTFIGENMKYVRQQTREPFLTYLASSVDLWRQEKVDLGTLSAENRQRMLDYAFERYVRTAALIGTPDTCMTIVKQLAQIGVDEIACLIDFGVSTPTVMTSLHMLNELRLRAL